MKRITVADTARYAALLAAMLISFTVERQLAVSHGVPVAVSPAVPVAIDLYLIWAVRTARDVAAAVLLAVAANVAGVLSAESLAAVGTWVSAGLHAVFPLAVWRMHRTPAVAPVSLPDVPADSEATNGRYVAAESVPGPDPVAVADAYWQDFEETADMVPDSADTPVTPPRVADIRAAMDVIASANGRPVTGPMLADHFGVSARTGRRYLALAAEAA
jgi:hypothetical protein